MTDDGRDSVTRPTPRSGDPAGTGPGDGRGTDLNEAHWTELDIESLWSRRGNRGAGRGWAGEVRTGFMRVSRTGLDDLMGLVGAGSLQLHDVAVVLWMLSAAAYRDDQPGVILDTDRGLSIRMRVPRQRLAASLTRVVGLGIIDRLYRRTEDGSDVRAGYRIPSGSWFWLTTVDRALPPWQVEKALAAAPAEGGAPGEEPDTGPTMEDIFGPA